MTDEQNCLISTVGFCVAEDILQEPRHPTQTPKNRIILIVFLQLLQELHSLPFQLILTQLSLLDRLVRRRSLFAP